MEEPLSLPSYSARSGHDWRHDASKLQPNLLRPRALNAAKIASLLVVGLAAILSVRWFGKATSNAADASPYSSFMRELQLDLNCSLDCCQQFEDDICPNENEWITAIPFGVQILLIVILISLSALFSGLTLGLMSLDKTGLEIVMSGDDPEAARYAQIIYPVREDGNLLLCTLLLGNVLVNTLLSILMAEYTGGVIGLFASTFLIVIFGEIVPQALVRRKKLDGGVLGEYEFLTLSS